jgi:hypothetical protein
MFSDKKRKGTEPLTENLDVIPCDNNFPIGGDYFSWAIEGSKEKAGKLSTFDESADAMMAYLEDSGISLTFQIIFAEIVKHNVPEEDVFKYTAMRVREIGKQMNAHDGKY